MHRRRDLRALDAHAGGRVIETLFCILTFALGWWMRGYYDKMIKGVQ